MDTGVLENLVELSWSSQYLGGCSKEIPCRSFLLNEVSKTDQLELGLRYGETRGDLLNISNRDQDERRGYS